MNRKIVLLGYALILLLSLVGICLQFTKPVRAAITWTVDDDGPADFSAIQEAINYANDGDTVFVKNGMYYENVFVNKTVSLIGENRDTTIIDGGGIVLYVFTLARNNVTLTGFTIQNGGYQGILLGGVSCCEIFENNITANHEVGICFRYSSYNTIQENNIAGNSEDAIRLYGSSHNIIFRNNITTHPKEGIVFYRSSNNNSITENDIANNGRAVFLWNGSANSIFHNNFMNNVIQTSVQSTSYMNVWDNGYPSGGNYWSDYTGLDSNGDGIGDAAYVIDTNNQDDHPLMNPWISIEAKVKVKGKDYPVAIISNTTIDEIMTTSNQLRFQVSGPAGETGYIRVIFPMVNTTEIKVFIDGQKLIPPFPVINNNGTHYFIYFEFTLSSHTIAIQFASPPVGGFWIPIDKFELVTPWISIALMITVATASIVYVKRRNRKQH